MTSPSRSIPVQQLKRLDFLLGQFRGKETLYPPSGPAIHFNVHLTSDWEPCERFLKVDYYGEIPTLGRETFQARITYCESQRAYRMWVFNAAHEEPIHLKGDFDGDSLVFVSDPTAIVWGLHRLRYTFTPTEQGYEAVGERWEPDGYVPHCSIEFSRVEAAILG
jgi:hypothetical protein